MQINQKSGKSLLIIGAGARSQVVREIAEQIEYTDFYYLDDNASRSNVIGTIKDLRRYKDAITDVFISIGDNALRKELYNEAIGLGFAVPTLISKYAYISRMAVIGNGRLICPMACVQSNVSIRDRSALFLQELSLTIM